MTTSADLHLSIDAAHDADTYNQGAPDAKPARKPRKPRISAMELELAAFRRGYAAGADAGDGSTTMAVVIGAAGGAGLVGMVWTLVHFL